MADITFNEDPIESRQPRSTEPKGLYKLAIKFKLAKNEAEAKIVLIAISIIAIGIAIIYPMLIL